jgi:hypothetical protein
MKIINVHQRLLQARPERAGALIDTLASPHDKLWPRMHWPRMVLDAPLGVGAAGGHGPIRYVVDAYEPGHHVRFRFTSPRGFDGWHALEVLDATHVHCVLEHRIEMNITGTALLMWPLLFRPLHDALVEDALANAQRSLGLVPHTPPWPAPVRLLRWLMRGLMAARRTSSNPPNRTNHAR